MELSYSMAESVRSHDSWMFWTELEIAIKDLSSNYIANVDSARHLKLENQIHRLHPVGKNVLHRKLLLRRLGTIAIANQLFVDQEFQILLGKSHVIVDFCCDINGKIAGNVNSAAGKSERISAERQSADRNGIKIDNKRLTGSAGTGITNQRTPSNLNIVYAYRIRR